LRDLSFDVDDVTTPFTSQDRCREEIGENGLNVCAYVDDEGPNRFICIDR